jgi:raw score 3.25
MKFDTISILEIEGKFFVPDYQRGYRWGEDVVKQLLDDIKKNGEINNQIYYLQPIVVKARKEGDYELIDGQQRLTTLYLILKYLSKCLPDIKIGYEIHYETRESTHDYLQDIDPEKSEENIDFFFVNQAYDTIKNWFNEDTKKCEDFLEQIKKYVKIIWYEPEEEISGEELFTRLNIGRIPLTNSELIRALFLSRNNGVTHEKQLEISTEWDKIEKELRSSAFWAFLTNEKEYTNRIELLFNMMANRSNEKDDYATFFFFNEKKDKISVWNEIIAYYEKLKELYEDRELFHKVGYLVALKLNSTQNILKETEKKKKSELKSYINEEIKKSLKSIEKLKKLKELEELKESLEELDYHEDPKEDIHKILLLFNIISMMDINDESVRFPFDKYKKNGTQWSLEHIHAQNAENLNTNEEQIEWLKLHHDAVKDINITIDKEKEDKEKEEKLNEIDKVIKSKNINKEKFIDYQQFLFKLLPNESDDKFIHSLSNLTLLDTRHNSALSNSAFIVKRKKIIEKDKEGEFIPYCTRMVFLKYYNENTSQLYFWDEDDRVGYITQIKEKLKKYLPITETETNESK